LWVRKNPDGGLQWTYRFRLNGRRREIGILGGSDLSLADARKRRAELAEIIARGEDPLIVRRAAEEARDNTFEALAWQTLEAKRPELKNERAIDNWIMPLRVHVFPKIGNRPVAEVTGPVIRDVLLPIWRTKPEVARKALMRIGVVLKFSAAAELDVDPFAADRAKITLGERMHRPKKTNAMPFELVPKFYQSLGDSPTEQALKLVILTGLRSAPVRLLRDEHVIYEVDAFGWCLLIPGENMKGKKKYDAELEFRVPLPEEARDVIDRAQSLAGRNGWVFTQPGAGKPMSYNTLPKFMERRGLDYRPHGFRSAIND